jgi:queuine tRNA-ribosyltransferase
MNYFTVTARDSRSPARCGTLKTSHGIIETPCFMPVGTKATVKGLTPRQLHEEIGAQIILANTYHLFLQPGEQIVGELGGLHAFMGWNGPILTDSGGFQVFSLASLRTLEEEGVTFQSPVDGSRHLLTPERAIEIQEVLGADIIMAFDECTPYPVDYETARQSLQMTARWAERCKTARRRTDNLLFGIVQGSMYPDLRRESAELTREIGFDGYALGGLSVGEEKSLMYEMVNLTAPLLPREQPRYLMGVGKPEDIVAAVAAGVDMFDCVLPTRNARNGMYFTWQGPLVIKQARYRTDSLPVDEQCSCYTCQNFSRAYLRHLFRSGEILSSVLATIHNLYFYHRMMEKIRMQIKNGTFADFMKNFISNYDIS